MNEPENNPPWAAQLPPQVVRAIACGLSLVAGAAVALMLHYLLYRLGLPSRPFIYVAF